MFRPKSDLRYELKYLLRRDQVEPLVAELRQQLPIDQYAGPLGMYPVTSLYYDTPRFNAYWDKLDGHRNRRKIRIRVYGADNITPQTSAFLEIKQRIDMMMRKRRVPMPYSQAVDLSGYADLGVERAEMGKSADRDTLHEVYYLYYTAQLRPVCVVTYDRMAFEGQEYAPDLRITLDFNIRGRVHDLDLASIGHTTDKTVLGAEFALLEIKASQNVPRWVAEMIGRHRCTFYRLSKYCMVLERCFAINQRSRVFVNVQAGDNSADYEPINNQ